MTGGGFRWSFPTPARGLPGICVKLLHFDRGRETGLINPLVCELEVAGVES